MTCRAGIADVDCKRVLVVPGPVLVPVEVRVVGANGSGVSKVVVEVRVLDY